MTRIGKGLLLAAPIPLVWIGMFHLNNGLAAMGFYHLFLLTVLMAHGIHSRFTPNPTSPPEPSSPGRFGLLTLTPFALTGPLVLLLGPWALYHPMPQSLAKLHLLPFWPVAIYYSTVNPLLEELFWRDTRGPAYQSAVHPVARDILFASYHLVVLLKLCHPLPAIGGAVALVPVSMLLRRLVADTGKRWPAVVAHVIADAGIAIAVIQLIK